jgi:hypothetical protein
MVELPELDSDPWPTFPIKKDLLRKLVALLEQTNRDRNMYAIAFGQLYDSLKLIAEQEEESEARKIARDALLW